MLNHHILIRALSITLLLFGLQLSSSAAEEQNRIPEKLKMDIINASKSQLIPGAVFYVITPSQTFTIPYGTTQIGMHNIPNADDYFRAGSNTKSMISAVIVQLAQENKLHLTDVISQYISGVPNGNKITLELLMKNRSGLYNYTADPTFIKNYDKNPSRIWHPQELLDIAFKHQIKFAPNEKFDYCNTNFILLGMIAEKLDRKPLAKIFQDRLFGPLGMKHTYLPTGNDNSLKNPYSHGYLYGDASHVFIASPYSAKEREEAETGTIKPNDYTIQNASWAWAAGGVITTAKDLAIWVKGLSNGKLFNDEYYQKWRHSFTRVEPNNQFVEYGYGMFLRTRGEDLSQAIYFHSGHLPGYHSYMIYDPVKQITIILWVNLAMILEGHEPGEELRTIGVDALMLNEEQP